MAYLCNLQPALPSITGSLGTRSMEVCGAFHPLLPGRRASLRSSHFTSTNRASSPCIFQWMHLYRYMKIDLHVGVYASFTMSPLMSTRNGYSSTRSNGFCKVCWSIEADIGDNQLIFLTGDLVSLGCWNPDMAVLLSLSTEGANLWYTDLQIPNGTHFKYNYFLKSKKVVDADLIWRPGPDFSLSLPLEYREEEEVVVRDFWMRTRLGRCPIPSWGSWMLDMELPVDHGYHINHAIHVTPAGEKDMSSNSKSSLSRGKKLSVSHASETNMLEKKEVAVSSGGSEEILSERGQPVEEPWLLQSILPSMFESSDLDVASKQEISREIESPGNICYGTEKATLEENQLACTENPISTVILINSSICTMQRIAVLEDGKLVELLIEPVKNNVQCDSIYLGAVTKLVPHMGGAFVDIGIARPSLMDIKQNREPFVFPLFQQNFRKEYINGFANAENNISTIINENYLSSDDDDGIDNAVEVDHEEESLHFAQEDFEDPQADDEIDVIDVSRNRSATSSFVVSKDNSEVFEEINENHLQDEAVEVRLTSEAKARNYSNFPYPIQSSNKLDNYNKAYNKWADVRKGTKVIVQVVKEGLGTKGPALSAYPKLKGRFWVLTTRCDRIGVSKKISGIERARLRSIAKTLQPLDFGLTVRTVAAGHSPEELKKDLDALLSTWKSIIEHAKSSALASEEGVDGAIPVMLHKAMGQTLSVVQDYFNEKVESMIVDSPRTYHEVTRYLQEIAPDLCQRVRLYDKRTPIFDEYNLEEEINNILSKRVPLSNGGSLVIEQTEALVSIDVNGGHGMLGQGTSQENAVLEVNLDAARQIARELRLRDIGGIIVVDFIDMADDSNKRLVYEEMKKAVERDHSMVKISELSKHGLMEITRKRVRPSVTFMISEPCSCCHAIGRVEALETTFSKIEHEICRLLAALDLKPDPENAKSWPQFVLKVDRFMCNYLTCGKRTKLAILCSALKVWILLKVARGFSRGIFEVKPFTDHEKDSGSQGVAISRLRHSEPPNYYLPNTKLTFFPVKKWKGRVK